MTSTPDPADLSRSDLLLGALLAVLAVAYLGTLPLSVLTPPDEAHALHQAVRLAHGEVLYRDLFDLATPLWTYLMAGLFSLFGTTLATARLAVAVVHGATMLVMFLLCRRFGVRRELAAIAALAYLALCQPVYPVANRHWLVTLNCLVLVLWCVAARRGALASFVAGTLVGAVIATHQQRGVTMGAAVVVWMLARSLLARRYGDERPAPLLASLAPLAAGVAAVVGPTLAVVVWKAGFQPVWYALVVHPLTHYYGTLRTRWAATGAFTARTTFPLFLKYLPVVLAPVAARLAVLARRRTRPEEARALLALLVFCSFAALSILYYPGLGHVAFIAPLFLVAFAESAEWLCRALPARWGVLAARAALALVLAGGAVRFTVRWRSEHAYLRVPRQTAFGRIDFAPWMARRYDELDRLLAGSPGRVLYVHPFSSFYYLMLGAVNPTPFEFLQPGTYNTDEHTRQVLDALRPENGVYVIFPLKPRRRDAVVLFVEQKYEPVEGLSGVWRPKRDGEARSADRASP